ncbi:unnamed protein product [Amoebophrya sp. A120]|nr:unnamed protein product [Amoebophrya sp. A120]|eukprot:GSA120T00006369001.1
MHSSPKASDKNHPAFPATQFPYKPRITGFLCLVEQICDAVDQR